MKIWVISSSYPRFPSESINAGVLARDLALFYAESGHSVTVVTPSKPGGVEFDREIEGLCMRWWRPSISLADMNWGGSDMVRAASLLLSGLWTCARHAVADRPDRVVALWAIPSGVFALAPRFLSGSPVTVWLLGSDVWKMSDRRIGRSLLRLTLRCSTSAFADGAELAQQAQSTSGAPVELLYSARRLSGVRSEHTQRRGMLYIGRYHHNKGPDLLIRALALDKKLATEVKTTMRGVGALQLELGRQISKSDLSEAVELGGPASADEVATLMAHHRLLVIPSRVDSIPLILGDAVQCEIPVVVSDVGSTGDFVRKHRLGVVVLPDDPHALANGLREAYAVGAPNARWDAARAELSLETAGNRLIER